MVKPRETIHSSQRIAGLLLGREARSADSDRNVDLFDVRRLREPKFAANCKLQHHRDFDYFFNRWDIPKGLVAAISSLWLPTTR